MTSQFEKEIYEQPHVLSNFLEQNRSEVRAIASFSEDLTQNLSLLLPAEPQIMLQFMQNIFSAHI